MQAEPRKSLVGQEYEVEVGPVAHGGHCIARTAEGQVLFVRHTLPGERVVARVTEGEEGARFLRADAVTVLEASKDRIDAPCPYAGPGLCGGCDWQHAKPGAQRRLKADVIAEQLQRLAGLTPEEAGVGRHGAARRGRQAPRGRGPGLAHPGELRGRPLRTGGPAPPSLARGRADRTLHDRRARRE
ncbi:putative RNA-binding protein with TRAM domain [Streptomyces sp. B3I7]|nr:putative RNA-binding protein with TRAM domain [Streptomyces sp. B3I7]